MRNLMVSTYISLDGVVEAPENWLGAYWSTEMEEHSVDQLNASDAVLLGRKTYEIFAAAWPERTGDLADRINALPKFVASKTIDRAEWQNTTVLAGEAVEDIAKMKQGRGNAILVYGSAELTRALLAHGLVDELRLWIAPVAVGGGARLFAESTGSSKLQLVDVRTFETGVVILTYRPA